MSAPDLNRALVLEQANRVADGAGGFSVVWSAVGTLWAEVKSGTGRDVAGEEVTTSSIQHRITVRGAAMGAPSRPKPAQRFCEGVRIFTILAVTEADPRGQFLTCFVREEVPA
jgi:head-tail adaptor